MGTAQGHPLLLVADRVDTFDPVMPTARAVLCEAERITWVGRDPADAPQPATGSPQRVEVAGGWLQPAFVDAHVHLTATGLALSGLDLHDCHSVPDCLAAVRAIADVVPGKAIWGAGWDDFRWPEARPPTADELVGAGGGRPVLLLRADGHSAVIDRVSLDAAPLARCDGVERDPEGRATGVLRREAAHLARRWFRAALPDSQLADARRVVVGHAVSLGIASLHEMGGPDLMGEADFDAWCAPGWPVEVVCYWGDADLDFVAARGLRHVGGALLLDGTVGSRSAALAEPYCDGLGTGNLYWETGHLADFLERAVHARVQVALHCIGDRAVAQAVEAYEAVAERTGLHAVRRSRPRFEHCEMVSEPLRPRMAALGVVASVRPGFDRLWGGPDGLYAARLGASRAAQMNPLRPLAEAGVTLAIGSDADVTPMDPWTAVEAAVGHHRQDFALDEDAAVRAAVLGGRSAARQADAGRIAPGQRADLAAFAVENQARRCVLTVSAGRIVHAAAGAYV